MLVIKLEKKLLYNYAMVINCLLILTREHRDHYMIQVVSDYITAINNIIAFIHYQSS
jgi:hypothetical protein